MNPAAARAVACPFCGLSCDDLIFANSSVDTRGCPKAAAGFARKPAAAGKNPGHQIAGRPASLEDAAQAAADILAKARLPVITGLGADLAGLRALVALADRSGAVIDRWGGEAQRHNLAIAQDSGSFLATFGEIANRAEAVLLIGDRIGGDYPRLGERLLRNPKPLYRKARPWVGMLGTEKGDDAGVASDERFACAPERLLEFLGGLSAILEGQKPRAATIGGIQVRKLEALAERLTSASYSALIWDAAAFPPTDAETALRLLLHILRLLNRKTRSAGLPLGGSDNSQGAAQVMLWQAGWPDRLSFARGIPETDPWLWDAKRLVTAGEADALLWVAAIAPSPPPATEMPTIAMVAVDVALSRAASVTIRVGVPGLDHGGAIVRADNVIALPLTATRSSALPSVAAAAKAIGERLSGGSP